MDKNRVILIVMDSLGVGELPDAGSYGDAGSDTFGHIAKTMGGELKIPNMRRLGFGNIDGLCKGDRSFAVANPSGSYGKLKEKSKGKDTITGHWEIAGVESLTPFKTYPDGFPAEFIAKFEERIGRRCIGNYAESGTVIIEKLGEEHERTGYPIVYTSADSVFQIAANIDVIPLEELYKICEVARELLQGEWACGRVIARPYKMVDGKRERTTDRRDYAVSPPEKTILNLISDAGQDVYAVGKIHDIFNASGVTDWVHTDGNMDGVDKTIEALDKVDGGFIFTNLVDFDSLYGHRRNPIGYGKAIMDFDGRIPEIESKLGPKDIVILCADHGNDPTHSGFDHTREHIPFVAFGEPLKSANIGTRECFADIGATICDYLGVDEPKIGESFLNDILK